MRRAIVAVLCAALATASASASAATLRWPAPTLVNPITINLGTGYTHTTLSTTRDYVVRLPATQKVGGTWLEGGHNIVIVGGAITIPKLSTSAGTAQHAGIYVKGATGTVHIQRVLIDGSGGGQFDGIDISAPQATVQLAYVRIVNVRGGQSSWHGDVVQPFGGVKSLRVDHLTGSSNFGGLFLDPTYGPIGSVQLSYVNLVATSSPPLEGGGAMLWLNNDPDVCSTFPISLENLWIKPRSGWSLAGAVWPAQILTPGACPKLTGPVHEGLPPDGSYVPAGAAGLSWRR
jgi:hypothetical protein